MSRALTTDLARWDPREAVEAKDALLAIEDHPGLQAIYRAVEARKVGLVEQVAGMPPTQDGSVYADLLGQVKALTDFPLIIEGIIQNGRAKENDLRAHEQEN